MLQFIQEISKLTDSNKTLTFCFIFNSHETKNSSVPGATPLIFTDPVIAITTVRAIILHLSPPRLTEDSSKPTLKVTI